jgi:elongation factor G
MLDAVNRYLPSPLDIKAIVGHKQGDASVVIERQPTNEEPFSALAFKMMRDPHLGKLTFVRIYSGSLSAGTVYTIVVTYTYLDGSTTIESFYIIQ